MTGGTLASQKDASRSDRLENPQVMIAAAGHD
jgi:hypothetical protein